MKYNHAWLVKEFEKGSALKYIFFWGHQAAKNGEITSSCFSQWWPSVFTVDGVEYKSAEHWMMAKKAELFNDTVMYAKILEAKSPAEAKKLGREAIGYDDTLWQAKRYSIVVQGNLHKFSQHNNLKAFLLNTNNRVLVEASTVDDIWGIGMAKENNAIHNPNNWKGLNLLGFALMEVRDILAR